jgi:hypothetical protein
MDQRRLARAIRTQQSENLTLRHFQIDTFEHRQRAIRFMDMANIYRLIGHVIALHHHTGLYFIRTNNTAKRLNGSI